MPRHAPSMRLTLIAFGVIAGLAALVLPSSAAAATFPGPDAFGYTAAQISGNLRDVSASGTRLSTVSTCDDCTQEVTLPSGFDFDFYGTSITSFRVSSNGLLNMGGAISSKPGRIPVGIGRGDDGLIQGLHEDLNPSARGDIFTDVLGAVGSREFVVGFYGVPFFANRGSTTFEIILHEGSDDIELQYGTIIAPVGEGASIGIQDFTLLDGLQIFLGNPQSNSAFGNISNTGFQITAPTAVVPLPLPAVLLISGFAALGALRGRRAH